MKLYIGKSFELLGRTFSFVLLKLLVYSLVGLAFGIIVGVALFIAGKSSAGGGMAFIILIGLLIIWGIFSLVRRYLLYLIKAGHVAAISELLKNDLISSGQGIISFGFSKVKNNFGSSSVYFIIDDLIHSIAHGISNFIQRMGNMIPVTYVQKIFNLIAKVLSIFLGFIDEAILSYIFTNSDNDPWKGSRDGLVLYFKSWKELLSTSAFIAVITYILSGILFFAFYFALGSVALFGSKGIVFVIAFVVVWIIKAGLLDQYALVAMIVSYQEAIKNKTVDCETMDQLVSLVPKFNNILEKTGREISTNESFVATDKSDRINSEVDIQPLRQYVANSRSQGYSDEQIRLAIQNQGWPEASIDEAFR